MTSQITETPTQGPATSPQLEATLRRAAELLRDVYGRDIELRFNSMRQSGGAWVMQSVRGVDLGLGICASLITAQLIADRRAFGLDVADLVDGDIHVFAHLRSDALADQALRSAIHYSVDESGGFYRVRQDSVEDALARLLRHGAIQPL